LKSFCIWGRLNNSFFTFATREKSDVSTPTGNKGSPVDAFYLAVKVDTKTIFG
jgi:hypothetical protein